jgi:hypothetical protein
MVTEITISYTGHGLGYNRYEGELTFTMCGDLTENTESNQDAICNRARREAIKKSACGYVSFDILNVKLVR